MVESQQDKPVLPVTGLFEELKQSDTATLESIVAKLFVADKDLASKTKIKEPIILAIGDTVALYAKKKGLKITGELFEAFLRSLRENYRSVDGWLVKEAKEMLGANYERLMREPENLGERLIGKRGR